MGELTFQDPKKKFCEELKAAREYKNLDISRVAEKTKIAQHYLEHLESGDWDFLPHAYVRAFLRTYAQVVGLEVGKVLDQFDSIVDEPPIPTPGVNQIDDRIRQREKEKKKAPKPKKKEVQAENKKPLAFTLAGDSQPEQKTEKKENSQSTIYWLIGLVAVVIVVGVVYFWPDSTPQEDVEEIPFEEVYQEHENIVNESDDNQAAADRQQSHEETTPVSQEPVSTEPEVTYTQDEEQVPPAEIRLHAEAQDKCYIRVLADMDTMPISDIVLENGMTRNYRADSLFTVVLGNAGGMKLFLGEEDLGELGEIGRVVTITIDRDGIRSKKLGVLRPPVEESPEVDIDSVDLTRPVGQPRESVSDDPVTFEETPPDTTVEEE